MVVYKAMIKTIIRKLPSLISYIIVFAVFGTIIARSGSASNEKKFELSQIKVAYCDKDDSVISRTLIECLKKSDILTEVMVDSEEDMKKLNDSVRFDIYAYAIVIPEGFGDSLVNGSRIDAEYLSLETSASSVLMSRRISMYLADVETFLEAGYSEEEAADMAKENILKNDSEVDMVKSEKKSEKSVLSGLFTFNAYSSLMLLCIGVAAILEVFKDKDVKARLIVSQISNTRKDVEVILSILTYGFAIGAIMVISSSIFAGKGADLSKIWYYSLNEAALVLTGVSLAYFLSAFTKEKGIIDMLANMTCLGMSFVCGVFVEKAFMAKSVLKIAKFLPVYWYVEGTEVIDANKLGTIWENGFTVALLMQILFAVVLMLGGLVVVRKKEKYVL